ncbi:MAG: hypothetical protein AB4911_15300 [Oscillochloridaceae bacterium umkhey_bin13]
MQRTIDVIVHTDGTIEPLEPVVVSHSRHAILTILDEVSPLPVTLPHVDAATTAFFAQLQAEGLIEVPEDIPAELRPLSRQEREALARRIPVGKPLSEIIIEDREEDF